jgi:hypothetical protein
MKKYLLLAGVVVLAMSMMGSVFAYFQDSVISDSNSFKAGTLDLKIADEDEYPPKDGVTATWTMSNMEPGISSVGPWGATLIDSGTLPGDHLEIAFTNSVNDPNMAPGVMARWLQVTWMSYDGVTFIGSIPTAGHVPVDVNGNGFIDLEDLSLPANSAILDNLHAPLPNSGGAINFTMQLLFNAGATNDVQGHTLTTTVTFTLNQNSSQ